MKKLVLSALAIASLAIGLASCKGGGSPKDSAETFLNGFYHMDYASAKKVATPATQKQLDAMEGMMGMMGANDKAKEEARSIKVTVNEPTMTSDTTATVAYTTSNDPSVSKNLKMVKRSGKWLAEWSKMDEMGGAGGMQPDAGTGMDTLPGDTTGAPMAPPADAPMMAPDTTSAY